MRSSLCVMASLQSFAVSRGAEASALECAFESLVEGLRASDSALIVELFADGSPRSATARSSAYALLDDGSRWEGGLLRRVVQQEDVAFFTDAEGGVLHPHLHGPIQLQHLDRLHSKQQHQTDGIDEEAQEWHLDQLLDPVKPLTDSSLVSEPYWKRSAELVHRSDSTPHPLTLPRWTSTPHTNPTVACVL